MAPRITTAAIDLDLVMQQPDLVLSAHDVLTVIPEARFRLLDTLATDRDSNARLSNYLQANEGSDHDCDNANPGLKN